MANNNLSFLPTVVLASVMALMSTDAAKAREIISIYKESYLQERMVKGITNMPTRGIEPDAQPTPSRPDRKGADTREPQVGRKEATL